MADSLDDGSQRAELSRTYRSYSGRYADRWALANPGNRAILAEREATLTQLLELLGVSGRASGLVLDLGAGSGQSFPSYFDGATNLIRLDILIERLQVCRLEDEAALMVCANGVRLPFPDDTFDLVVLGTVLSSIRDRMTRMNVVAEARRVTKSGGGIVCYDFRVGNPRNPHTRPVRRAELRRLLPECESTSRSLTVLPGLARRLGGASDVAYRGLRLLPFLRTHRMTLWRC